MAEAHGPGDKGPSGSGTSEGAEGPASLAPGVGIEGAAVVDDAWGGGSGGESQLAAAHRGVEEPTMSGGPGASGR